MVDCFASLNYCRTLHTKEEYRYTWKAAAHPNLQGIQQHGMISASFEWKRKICILFLLYLCDASFKLKRKCISYDIQYIKQKQLSFYLTLLGINLELSVHITSLPWLYCSVQYLLYSITRISFTISYTIWWDNFWFTHYHNHNFFFCHPILCAHKLFPYFDYLCVDWILRNGALNIFYFADNIHFYSVVTLSFSQLYHVKKFFPK